MRITHRVGPGEPRTGARLAPFSPVAGFRPARRLNGRLTLAAGLAILSVLALLVGLSFVVPDTQTVLQATRDLPAGAVVQADDVMPVKVRLPETRAQTAYAGTAVDQVVGRRTGVRIPAGQLLGPSQFNVQHTSVAPGRVQAYAWAVAPGPGGASLVQEYRQMYQEASPILAERYAASADDPQRAERALELHEELVRLDPSNERLWSALFRLHARLGDRVALEREWRRLCQVLQDEEPGAQPRGTTRELYQQLLRSLESQPAAMVRAGKWVRSRPLLSRIDPAAPRDPG